MITVNTQKNNQDQKINEATKKEFQKLQNQVYYLSWSPIPKTETLRAAMDNPSGFFLLLHSIKCVDNF
jgi:hypothetical protein